MHATLTVAYNNNPSTEREDREREGEREKGAMVRLTGKVEAAKYCGGAIYALSVSLANVTLRPPLSRNIMLNRQMG